MSRNNTQKLNKRKFKKFVKKQYKLYGDYIDEFENALIKVIKEIAEEEKKSN